MVIKVRKPSTQQKPKCTSEKALWRENLRTKQHFKIRAHPFWRRGWLHVGLQNSTSGLHKMRERLHFVLRLWCTKSLGKHYNVIEGNALPHYSSKCHFNDIYFSPKSDHKHKIVSFYPYKMGSHDPFLPWILQPTTCSVTSGKRAISSTNVRSWGQALRVFDLWPCSAGLGWKYRGNAKKNWFSTTREELRFRTSWTFPSFLEISSGLKDIMRGKKTVPVQRREQSSTRLRKEGAPWLSHCHRHVPGLRPPPERLGRELLPLPLFPCVHPQTSGPEVQTLWGQQGQS